MNRPFVLASALLLGATLPSCKGIHVPSPAETGAGKIANATAKARALAGRIACSPDAVGKTVTNEAGEAREITQTLMAPAEAADELRTLATEVANAGGTEPQRREAKSLAARMRRDALLLDLMDLERVSQLKGMVVAGIEERIARVRSIQASGELTATVELEAQLKSFRQAGSTYEELVSAVRKGLDEARGALQPIEAEITEKRSGADRLDSEVQTLRGQAAISEPEQALPIIDEAREKLNAAQDLRRAASEAEQGAEQYRSAVRIGSAALGDDDPAAAMLEARIKAAQDATEAGRARADAAKARTEAIMAELGDLAKELQRLQTELYEPAVKSVEEALQAGDFPSKGPTDAAMVAIAKARFAAIRADSVDQGLVLAASAGAGDGGAVEQLRAERAKFADEAKAALVEARDGLGGADATVAAPFLTAIDGIAAALGVEVPTAKRPGDAAAEGSSDAPAADAPAAGDPAAEAPAPPADPSTPPADPSTPPADPSTPPADPSTPPADPSTPPADPSTPPADPTPPPADPGADEPNK